MRFLILVLLAAFATVSTVQAADPSPAFRDFSVTYTVHRGDFEVAEAGMELHRMQDGIYRFTSRSEAIGMLAWFMDDVVIEESIFRLTDEGFFPVSYAYRHKGSDKNRDESISYDWTNGTAELDYRGTVNTVRLKPGMVDRFLLQLAAAQGMKNGEVRQEHRVLDNGRVKTYYLEAREPETITVPAGTFETRVITKVDEDDDKHITFWFAPELDYVPVRLEHMKKNEEPIRMELKRVVSPSAGSAPAKP